MTQQPSIEFDDIQGLVRFGHARLAASRFLLLKIKDQQAAKQWLSTASPTSAKTLSTLPDTVLQLAFTASGLQALGLQQSVVEQFSEAFISGMSSEQHRSRRLGDTGNNDPQHWRWGGQMDNNPHLLIMLYSNLETITDAVAGLQQGIFNTAFEIQQQLVSDSSEALEPFGFADGISQPQIDWQQTLNNDQHATNHYRNTMALGEILLGYRNEYGLYTERPLLDPDDNNQQLSNAEENPQLKDLGRNGSYLVFRELSQDVAEFWQYVDQQADSEPQQRQQLAAAMVGRQRDGTPLLHRSHRSTDEQNDFDYRHDPHGLQCPIAAHVRRANPRTGDFPAGVSGFFSRLVRTLGFGRQHPLDDVIAASRFHRILRRGRIYGSQLDVEKIHAGKRKPAGSSKERGLHFICLCANISRQFEFIQGSWLMSSKFAGLPTEGDPLLGNRQPLLNGESTNHFSQPQTEGPPQCSNDLPQFVTVKGGGYFFMPGIKALRYLSTLD